MDNGLSCGPSLPSDPWPTGEQLSARVFLKSLSVPQLRGNHVYGAHQKRVWRLSSCLKDLKPWKGLFILRLFEPEQGTGPFGRAVPRHQFLPLGQRKLCRSSCPSAKGQDPLCSLAGGQQHLKCQDCAPHLLSPPALGGQHGVRRNDFHDCPPRFRQFPENPSYAAFWG